MKRIIDVTDIWRHKIALYQIWRRNKGGRKAVSFLRVLLHDMDKLILCILIGDKIATHIHRRAVGHHARLHSDKNLKEAYLDWASARITKPNKPYDAVDTAIKIYPQHLERVMKILEEVGFK